MNDREDLYQNWVGWVTTNLGRDTRLAEIAASAASDAAEHGRGFNDAAEAARIAWADATRARSTSDVPQPRGEPSVMPAQRLALGVIAAVLVTSGVMLGLGGPGGPESLSKAAWLGAAISAVIWIALRPVASLRTVKPAVWLSLTLILAALLCWPAAGWLLNGLDQIGLFGQHDPAYSWPRTFSMPFVASALGWIGSAVGLIARQRAAASTGRRLALVTSVTGCLLAIVAMVWGVLSLVLTMYSCYAVMC